MHSQFSKQPAYCEEMRVLGLPILTKRRVAGLFGVVEIQVGFVEPVLEQDLQVLVAPHTAHGHASLRIQTRGDSSRARLAKPDVFPPPHSRLVLRRGRGRLVGKSFCKKQLALTQ
jgi:hypothetical protein